MNEIDGGLHLYFALDGSSTIHGNRGANGSTLGEGGDTLGEDGDTLGEDGDKTMFLIKNIYLQGGDIQRSKNSTQDLVAESSEHFEFVTEGQAVAFGFV